MATNFYFRAVASDGKMRTGMLARRNREVGRAANCASRGLRPFMSESKRRSRSS